MSGKSLKGTLLCLSLVFIASCSGRQLISSAIVSKPPNIPLEIAVEDFSRLSDSFSVTVRLTNTSGTTLFVNFVGVLLLAEGQSGADIEAKKTVVDLGQIPAEVRWNDSIFSGLQDRLTQAVGNSAPVMKLEAGTTAMRALSYRLPENFKASELYFRRVLTGTVQGRNLENLSFSVPLQ